MSLSFCMQHWNNLNTLRLFTNTHCEIRPCSVGFLSLQGEREQWKFTFGCSKCWKKTHVLIPGCRIPSLCHAPLVCHPDTQCVLQCLWMILKAFPLASASDAPRVSSKVKVKVNPDLHPSWDFVALQTTSRCAVDRLIVTGVSQHWRYIKACCLSSRCSRVSPASGTVITAIFDALGMRMGRSGSH